ncbi:hypothetical protein [Geobacter sp. AOG1]|uniref:hypothetical protein n=1 Tax=Geobacter sp. AOG1 TaxID=1566346 RepID=UPI001CC5D3B0|nr:hypothetical protein [Geobacter sp. AOG1]GFE57021.1 hypothetical protein AOG1_09000 [Geobacter sp. AOG1]
MSIPNILSFLRGGHLHLAPSPKRDRIINICSLLVLLLIGWLDYVTGYEFGFFIFYFIPVSISAWFVGRRSGLAIACASAICWYLSDKYTYHPYSKAYFIYWEMFMRLVSFLTTAVTIARIRQMLVREVQLNGELQAALDELERLRGITDCTPPSRESAAESDGKQ